MRSILRLTISWQSRRLRQSLYTAAILENGRPNLGTESKTSKKSVRLVVEFHEYGACVFVSNLPNIDSDWPVSKYSVKHGRHTALCIEQRAVLRYVNPDALERSRA